MRIVLLSLLGFILFSSTTLFANKEDGNPKLSAEDQAKLEKIEARAVELEKEITALKLQKKAATTKSERKNLLSEIKEAKAEARALMAEGRDVKGGIYIGTGTLIIILLLILLL